MIVEIPSCRPYGTLIERQLGICNTELRINTGKRTEACAVRTCSLRTVKGEASGIDLTKRDAAVRACQMLREKLLFRLINLLAVLISRSSLKLNAQQAVSELQGRLA